jgi:hypothetical protein
MVTMARHRTAAQTAAWGRTWLQSSGRLMSCAARISLQAPEASQAMALSERRAHLSGTRCRGSHRTQASRDVTGVRRACKAQRPNMASASSARYSRSRSSDSSSLNVLGSRSTHAGRQLEYKRRLKTKQVCLTLTTGRLVAGLSTQRLGFAPWSAHVRFVVDKVKME